MCVIGAKKSGKTTLASQAAIRTNYKLINFRDFIKSKGLKGSDDETLVLALINSFFYETEARIMIEDFPQNLFQAKFFIRNCKNPSKVFYCNCSKDFCQ